MTDVFKVKVRRVGDSLGFLIPKRIVDKENIREGEEVEVGILKQKKLDELLKLQGIAKGWKPFRRDRTDRLDRYLNGGKK